MLSDAEAGRLLKALLHYANDITDTLPGQEKLVFAMLKTQIDRDAASYQDFLDKQRVNGKKGGRPKNPSLYVENLKNPSLFGKTQKTQEKEKEEENINVNVNVKDARAREELPFGLTDADIHDSLTRDSQIEDAARSAGLNTSETAMLKARDFAQQYGLDTLLDAIKKTPLQAQKPSWAYVEGILKGGNGNDNRGNHSGVSGNGGTSGKYAHLFT
jgi:hypothetical protein